MPVLPGQPADPSGSLAVDCGGAGSSWVNSQELEVDFLRAGLLLY